MHCAAIHGQLAIAKRLLEGGADVTLGDKRGWTALDDARRKGKSEVVALLSEPRYAGGDRPMLDCEAISMRRRGGAVLGARGPRVICRSANESRRAAMGCGREVATHALWGDTAPRDCTSWRRVQNDRILGAVVGTLGVGGTGGLGGHSRCGCGWLRRPRRRQRPDARSGAR